MYLSSAFYLCTHIQEFVKCKETAIPVVKFLSEKNSS